MIINKEFFFRGWLPAGLVINARLLLASPSEGIATLKPIINPQPGFGWPIYQPSPSFPIEQANDVNAIILKDAFPEGTVVMLPSGDWFGSGTPYVLAVNTWYEGRIQSVSGGDVMAIRILFGDQKSYYWTTGYPDPRVDPDICVSNLACKFIPGRTSHRALAIDIAGETGTEYSYPPMVAIPQSPTSPKDLVNTPARLMDVIKLSAYQTFGLQAGLKEDQNKDSFVNFIQCVIADGKLTGTPQSKYEMYGIAPVPSALVQMFYMVAGGAITARISAENVLSKLPADNALAVISESGDDQVIHYN